MQDDDLVRDAAFRAYDRAMEEQASADQAEVGPAGADAPGAQPPEQPTRESRLPILIGIGAVVVLVIAATLGVVLSGKSGPQPNGELAVTLCKETITDRLKDPDSARFGAVTSGDEQQQDDGSRVWEVAGTVNAKNSYGGYVGFKPFTCTARVASGSDSMTATADILD